MPFGSVIAKKAVERKIPIKYESFADRNYNDNLTLVSRKLDNAVMEDREQILEHVTRMVKENKVKTITGQLSNIETGTVCVHGDNPHAVEIVAYLAEKLKEAQISVE